MKLRNSHFTIALALCGIALGGCDNDSPNNAAQQAGAVGKLGTTLALEQAANLGLRTAPALPAAFLPHLDGYGVVSSFANLSQAVSDVATAEAAARQSAAALSRARRLSTVLAISREVLDAAERQASTDAIAVTLAQRKEATEYGRDAPWLRPGSTLLTELANGKEVLMHISFPLSPLGRSGIHFMTIRRVSGSVNSVTWSTSDIWSAPADASIPGQSYYALVRNSDLAEGERVLATIPSGPPINGVTIPFDAVVLSGDRAWFYTSEAHGFYARHQLDLSKVMKAGYFVPADVVAGRLVVIQGAGLLLAHELNPPSKSGD